MKNKLKNKVRKIIEDYCDSAEQQITDNQYEPSERGAGTMTDERTCEDIATQTEAMVLSVLELFGVKENMKDLSFEELLEEIDSNNFNLDEYDELKELDTVRDSNSDPKYIYKCVYYLHKKENRTIELCVQDGGEHQDNFMHALEVKKVEVVTNEYQAIK